MGDVPRDFDVEDLKVHRIAPPPAREKKARVHLPLAGPKLPEAAPGDEDLDEAFGGSGEAGEVVAADALRERVIATLRTIYDPEIPLNVFDLGLIYEVTIDGAEVEIQMTLTAPACPVAGQIVRDVAQKVGATPGVAKSHVQLVWDPPWTKDRMSDEALLELGLL